MTALLPSRPTDPVPSVLGPRSFWGESSLDPQRKLRGPLWATRGAARGRRVTQLSLWPQTGWSSKAQLLPSSKGTLWFCAARPGEAGPWPRSPSTEMALLWVPPDLTGNSRSPWLKRRTAGITTAAPSSRALVLGARKRHPPWRSPSKVRARGGVAVAEQGGQTSLLTGGEGAGRRAAAPRPSESRGPLYPTHPGRCPGTRSAPVQASEDGTERLRWSSPETSFPRACEPELSPSFPSRLPELFPAPVLRAMPSPEPQEGSAVTLSCQTKLPLQRSATRLLFSFHKGGRAVRGRGLSPELQVPAAAQAHSGSYWCEAATEDNHVWKRSPRLEIRVQGEWCVEGGQEGGPCGAQCEQRHSGGSSQEPGPWGRREYRQGLLPRPGAPLRTRTTPAPQLLLTGDAPARGLGTWRQTAPCWLWEPHCEGCSWRETQKRSLGSQGAAWQGSGEGREALGRAVAQARGGASSMKVPPRGLRPVLRAGATHMQGTGRIPDVHTPH